MNTIREIQKINEQELALGIAGTPGSWHAKYAPSAWVYVGNLDHGLTEGDVICVLSQYGEIEDFHLVRDDNVETGNGKSKGFAFCKYEDARSCILAVDNFCGIQLCGRSLRVDHVENYRLPKHLAEKEGGDHDNDRTKAGHAYDGQELASSYNLNQGVDLFAPPPVGETSAADNGDPTPSQQEEGGQKEEEDKHEEKKRRRSKEEKKRHKKREEKERRKQERAKIREERELRRKERKKSNNKEQQDHERKHQADDEDDNGVDQRRHHHHKKHKSKRKHRDDKDDESRESRRRRHTKK